MSDITVVEWRDLNDLPDDLPESCGGLGGWFRDGNTWDDYLRMMPDHQHPYLEALRAAMTSGDVPPITGEMHQHGWAPVFSDGTCGSFSFRAWGDLLAAIFTTPERPLSYMDGYYVFHPELDR